MFHYSNPRAWQALGLTGTPQPAGFMDYMRASRSHGWARLRCSDCRCRCECLPDAGNYVDLDPDRVDEAARSIACIHSHRGDMAIRRISFMDERCRELRNACGVEERVEEFGSYDLFSSKHVFGTCRMGQDADHAVVNADCRSHRWKNMYIVDSSVFPSSGGGESPSLTIEAPGLRDADAINSRI